MLAKLVTNLSIMRSISPNIQMALAGLLATLAFAPIDLPIFLLPSFYLLLDGIYQKDFKTAYLRGVVYGFFHFISSLYWVSIALTANVGDFLWLIPFALILIPLALGLYVGMVCGLASLIKSNRILFVMGFCLCWTWIEHTRGFYPLPFPWNFTGYTLAASNHTIKLAPYLGGVTLSTLLVVYIATIAFAKNRFLTLSSYGLLVIAVLVVGITSPTTKFHEGVKVRLVQPNAIDHHLGNPAKQQEVLAKLIALSTAEIGIGVKSVIWPEAAYPYLFKASHNEVKLLQSLAPKDGFLIFGADRVDSKNRYFNSMVAVGSDGKVISEYDKRILVPFGEYVPLASKLSFIGKIAYGLGQFSTGLKHESILDSQASNNYYPLICYEAIFPIDEDITSYDWGLNITNDAWFGNSSGPYQHLNMVRFKAAEHGMPIIRVANGGISAVISPLGEVLRHLPLNTANYIDSEIPKKIVTRSFAFKNFNTFILMVSFLICLCLNLIIKPIRNNSNKS